MQSAVSQYVILRSEPTVSSCDSSGWYVTARKMVDAKNALARVPRRRFHTTHEPSADDESASSSFADTVTLVTSFLCSLKESSIACERALRPHVRTRPSLPPVTSFVPACVKAMAVTASMCASAIVKSSLPVSGEKARTLPSSQPDAIVEPSRLMHTQRHAWLGTWMRSSSRRCTACHTRMSLPAAVMKSSDVPSGNTRSEMPVAGAVPRSCVSSVARFTP